MTSLPCIRQIGVVPFDPRAPTWYRRGPSLHSRLDGRGRARRRHRLLPLPGPHSFVPGLASHAPADLWPSGLGRRQRVPRRNAGDGAIGLSRGRAHRLGDESRLLGREQHRDSARSRAVRARAQPGHPRDGRISRSSDRPAGDQLDDRDRRLSARARRWHLRSRRTASFSHTDGRVGSLHGRRAPFERARVAGAVPRTCGREWAGRCGEWGVHAHAPTSARRGRPLRRGLLDVHGGSRPLLPVRPGRVDDVVRAFGERPPREGRLERPLSLGPPQLRVPLWDVSVLPQALRARDQCVSESRRVRGDRREARRVARSKRRSSSIHDDRETKGSRHTDGSTAERKLSPAATFVSSHDSMSEAGGRTPVSALIVTWNNEATVADCISALRRELPAASEILVFDNDSLDGSAHVAQDSGARVQKHDSNIGFAAGMNRLAADGDGGLLLVVNPDLFVSPGSVDALLSHFPTGHERKIVGGLLLTAEGEPEPASARPFPTAVSLVRWLLSRSSATWSVPASAQEVPAVSGAFFAIPSGLWCELDGFDEGYLHSGEDLDLFWRAARAGARVWFDPAAKATHLGGASVRQAPLEIDAVRLSGALRLVRRREGRLAAALLRAVLFLRSLIVLVLDRLRLHPLSAPRRARAKALLGLAVAGEGDPRLRLPTAPERSE